MTAYKDFVVTPGKPYNVDFDLDRTGIVNFTAEIYTTATLGGTGTLITTLTATNGRLSYTLTPVAGQNFIRVYFKKNSYENTSFYIDNLQIRTVAAPYAAVVVMKSDYYPYGMQMPGRHTNDPNYRYGYNGMEKDAEMHGEGNSYTTEFRQYDPRLGRWLSLDPLMADFPWMSPYVAFNNNPIYFTDPYGLSPGGPEGAPKDPKNGTEYKDKQGNNWLFQDGEWGNYGDAAVVEVNRCLTLFEYNIKEIMTSVENFQNLANPRMSTFNNVPEGYVDQLENALYDYMDCAGLLQPPPPSVSESTGVHDLLDLAGMIPIIGEVFDLVNAVIYLSEGDLVNAGISTAALIPVFGSAAPLARKVTREVIHETEKKVVRDVSQNGLTRREAINAAEEHAQVPRPSRGGRDISIDELNPSSRGPNWEKMKSRGGKKIGRENPNGRNKWEEHPDGHPDAGQPGVPEHHGGGHVHSTDREGVKKVFPYIHK